MRLQKQINRIVENKEYAKFVVIMPPEHVQQLGWQDGQELEGEVKDETYLLRKAKTRNPEDALKLIEKHRKERKR
jgi:antitoxin component of MazEF toxin-antitoxin module